MDFSGSTKKWCRRGYGTCNARATSPVQRQHSPANTASQTQRTNDARGCRSALAVLESPSGPTECRRLSRVLEPALLVRLRSVWACCRAGGSTYCGFLCSFGVRRPSRLAFHHHDTPHLHISYDRSITKSFYALLGQKLWRYWAGAVSATFERFAAGLSPRLFRLCRGVCYPSFGRTRDGMGWSGLIHDCVSCAVVFT
jgi:hypothetical protein